MMMNSALSQKLNRTVKRSVLLGALSSIAVLAGWAPNLSGQAKLFDSAAYAQDSELTRYAIAAVSIERIRQPLMNQVKQLTGGNAPRDICSPGNISKLDSSIQGQVQGICANFRKQAADIITANKLEPKQFNYYYQRQDQDAGLRSQIAAEIKRLRAAGRL